MTQYTPIHLPFLFHFLIPFIYFHFLTNFSYPQPFSLSLSILLNFNLWFTFSHLIYSLRSCMKQLIRRLSRVSDSSQYCLIRSESIRRPCRVDSFRLKVKLRRRNAGNDSKTMSSKTSVPQGHIPVYVGDEMERFVVSAKLFNHPMFVELLNKSAQEYGYDHEGGLRIPCRVLVFERLLEALRLGYSQSHDVNDLIASFSDEFAPAQL